jgi:hypothetical protein
MLQHSSESALTNAAWADQRPQKNRRMAMKYSRMITAALMMLGFVVGSVHGQAGAPRIKVAVPFRFAIEGKTFTAGQYAFISSRDKLWVQEASGRNVAVLFTGALEGKVPVRDGNVIFDCYLDECFLSQVWIGGAEAGRTLPKSKHEIQLAKQIALMGRKSQPAESGK